MVEEEAEWILSMPCAGEEILVETQEAPVHSSSIESLPCLIATTFESGSCVFRPCSNLGTSLHANTRGVDQIRLDCFLLRQDGTTSPPCWSRVQFLGPSAAEGRLLRDEL
jgi:hypothetical protein